MSDKITTNLFIGGPYDGQHKAILHGSRVRLNDGSPTQRPTEYRRETLVADDAEFLVWVEDGLTLRQAMAHLLTGYGK